jgi:hypothetical protein
MTFLFGAAVGAGLIFGAQRYHLLRTSEGFYVIPKLNATFSEAYVDIRAFTLGDWVDHRALAGAIIKAKKDHLLEDSATDNLKSGIESALESLTNEAG